MFHKMTKALHVVQGLFLSAVLILGLALAVGAQTQPNGPDYDAWDTVAQRAESAVENGRASSAALESLRTQVAVWRQTFLDAQSLNKARIETLESQLSSLGTPAEGVEEVPEVAQRRQELTEQLTRLRAPVLTAEAAYSRADGVIREIDRLIRERQTDELLQAGPSPLNPLYWTPALDALRKSSVAMVQEVQIALKSETERTNLVSNLPRVLIYALIGIVFLLRGRRWSLKAVDLLRQYIARGSGVARFLASLLQILIPYLGVTALVAAVLETQLIGLRGTLILDNVPQYGLLLLGMWWLGEQLFPRAEDDAHLPISATYRAAGRRQMIATAIILIAAHTVNVLANYDKYDDATRAVLGFPLLILTGVVLYRIGTILGHVQSDPETDDAGWQYRSRMARLIGQVAILVAFVGPIIAALGFGTAAARLMFSSVASLALFGALLVLQAFVRDVYGIFMGKGKRAEDSLVPVLIGFMLVLAALPLLALIWGARVADLTEIWTRFQEGFAIGESRISPSDFLAFAIIFAIGYAATRLLQGTMRSTILPRTKLDAGGRNAIVSGIGYVGIFLAALAAISTAGIDLSSLAIVAGALSVGIGFGLQNIVSNFVSGIILLIERPIAEGDWIEVGGKMGYVRAISVRSTRIETFDRTDVIVPNADLVSGVVTNWTHGKTVGRVIVPVGVAYGNDTRKVEDILLNIAREHPMVLMNPPPSIVFQGFGADSLNFEIRAILRDVNYSMSVRSEMNHQIAERFNEEGIEIPFAQRDIWLRNPEALAPQQPQNAAPQSPAETSKDASQEGPEADLKDAPA